MSDILNPVSLRALLADDVPGLDIECVAETGSTNADLLARLPTLEAPLLLAAETQTAGRGRAGRSWVSPPGGSLAFSLAWPFFRRPLAGLLGLPLAVGVAVAETLQALGVDARLKWPNDILLEEGKLGGILVETGSVERAGYRQLWAVIGIGLNIAMPAALPSQSLAAAGMPALLDRRNALLAALAARLAEILPVFDQHGFAPFAARWNALHAHAGRQVCILDHGRVLHEGRASGVDDKGCLLLESAQGLLTVHVGDVSLRSAGVAS